MKRLVFPAVWFALFPPLLFATIQSTKTPTINYPLMTGDEEVEAPVIYPPYPLPSSLDTREIVGDTVVIGTTWYDIQHNGTIGRMLEKDEFGYIHFAWMNGLDYVASNRHIYYNYIDPSGNQGYPGTGCQVDYSNRAGYVTLDVDYEGRAFPVFHQYDEPAVDFWTAVGADYYPHSGTFITYYAPDCSYPYVYELCWPKMQFDRNGLMHVIVTENPYT
jgi:hypothetical protein